MKMEDDAKEDDEEKKNTMVHLVIAFDSSASLKIITTIVAQFMR
jgi:hypothetical protein